jgi:hypothetical protein
VNQLKSLDALIKFKNEGVVDPESIAPYKYEPPLETPGNVLCRVHATRDGSSYWAYGQAPRGEMIYALCKEHDLEFIGIRAGTIGLDEPIGRMTDSIREALS